MPQLRHMTETPKSAQETQTASYFETLHQAFEKAEQALAERVRLAALDAEVGAALVEEEDLSVALTR